MITFKEYMLLEQPPGPPMGGIGAPGAMPGGMGPPGLGGPPMGGAPMGGAPPMGGLGGPPPGMGPEGGMPGQQKPLQLKPLDVWQVLERILAGKI